MPTDHAAAAVQDPRFDLREHVTTKLPKEPVVKLQRSEVQHEGNFADFIVEGAPQVPSAVHRSHLEHDFPMDGNDKLGDCGEAMTAHGIEAFHLDAGTPVPTITEEDVIKWYSEVAGYVEGDPETDQGTNNETLVEKWKGEGLPTASGENHKIVASLFVDPTNVEHNQRAIWEFVVLFRAIALPLTAQGQKEWAVTEPHLQGEAEPGSWGGHDIPYLSYDGERYRNATWGTELLVSYAFDKAYAMQGFVVITQEMLNQSGVSPAGFNYDALKRALPELA